MKHFLGLEGISKDNLHALLSDAKSFIEVSGRELKKVPALRGKTIINLFLEPSTRTRTSFEIAGKRLSADTINISGTDSSVVKGETLLDTLRTLEAMAPDVVVMRHGESGAPHFIAKRLGNVSVVNAGDGMHEHPTQAMLDLLTLSERFKDRPNGIEKLVIAIVGDIRHSRVARSNIWAHIALGNEVRLVAPPTLVPPEFCGEKCFGNKVKIYFNLEEGLKSADVVMCLRMQLERQKDKYVPSLEEYSRNYCVSERLLKRVAPECVVMHPGPANRGIEVSSEVLDGPRSLMRNQVAMGVAVRMSVLFSVTTGRDAGSE